MSFDPMRTPAAETAPQQQLQGVTDSVHVKPPPGNTYHSQDQAHSPASYGLSAPKKVDSSDKSRASMSLSEAVKTPANWVALLWLMTGNFAWSIAGFTWMVTTVSVGFSLLVLFPVGPPILLLFALSWRGMAFIELLLSNRWSDRSSSTPVQTLVRVVPKLPARTGSLWTDFWALFATTMMETQTWISVVYFSLLKVVTATFNFVLLVAMSAASLSAIANPIVLASCSVCYERNTDDGRVNFPYNNGFTEFMLTSVGGQFFLVPLGIALLCVTVLVAGRLARVEAELANRLLIPQEERRLTQRLSTGEIV